MRLRKQHTSPNNLTPSLTPCTQRLSYNSFIVIGFVGSIKPLSIQCCNLSKFNGVNCCLELKKQMIKC